MFVEHVGYWFLISLKDEESSVAHSLTYCLCFFSMDTCESSPLWRVGEKKATVLPFWLSEANGFIKHICFDKQRMVLLVAVITASSYVSFRPSTPQKLYFIGSRYILWQLEARVSKVKLVKTLDRWKVLSIWTIWCIIYGKIMQFKTTPTKRMFLKLFSYRL